MSGRVTAVRVRARDSARPRLRPRGATPARLLLLVAIAFGVMQMHTFGHSSGDHSGPAPGPAPGADRPGAGHPGAAAAHSGRAPDLPAMSSGRLVIAADGSAWSGADPAGPASPVDPLGLCLAVLAALGFAGVIVALLTRGGAPGGGGRVNLPVRVRAAGRDPPGPPPLLRRLAGLSVLRI